jgi:hypothetical protein
MSKSIAREKALLCDHLSRRLGRPVIPGRVNKGRVLVRVLGARDWLLRQGKGRMSAVVSELIMERMEKEEKES